MKLEELKDSNYIIFECISGSRAYGLDTATSDTDIRGVFILPLDIFYSLDYIGQISNESNDIVYYELRRFIELCTNNNPNILELLNVPDHCVLYKHPIFDSIKSSMFLSRKCEMSFGNYAYSQIKKARGLNKKIVNPVEKIQKSVLDFCSVYEDGSSIGLRRYLEIKRLKQEGCGLSKIPHMKDCFNLYHDQRVKYNGIIKSDNSNEVALSSIPKDQTPLTILFFNRDGYSTYCKKYREYWDWVDKRNENRYLTTIAHGKNFDSKNMMHTIRLLYMAEEIATKKKVVVARADREHLLSIKEGKYDYDELLLKAESLKAELKSIYQKSDLQEQPDIIAINKLLIRMRKEFYSFSN